MGEKDKNFCPSAVCRRTASNRKETWSWERWREHQEWRVWSFQCDEGMPHWESDWEARHVATWRTSILSRGPEVEETQHVHHPWNNAAECSVAECSVGERVEKDMSERWRGVKIIWGHVGPHTDPSFYPKGNGKPLPAFKQSNNGTWLCILMGSLWRHIEDRLKGSRAGSTKPDRRWFQQHRWQTRQS